MKNTAVICVLAGLLIVYGKKIPEFIDICTLSEADYTQCVLKSIEKNRENVIKGIPEVGLPPLDPFKLSTLTVDKSVNNLVKVKGTVNDVEVSGASNTIINSLKLNPKTMSGEIAATVPWFYLTMNYDVDGRLLVIPLKSRGYFKGNFTDIKLYVKGSVKTVTKENQRYFKLDKLQSKITVGSGNIKLISKNPQVQFAADIITKFFNENPRRTLDLVNPMFIETSNDLFRTVFDQILESAPASEWLPEK